MNKGFSNLAELFREKNDTAYENNASVAALSESESDDCGSRSDVQPAPKKKKKRRGFVLYKDNSDILNKPKRSLMSLNKMALKFMKFIVQKMWCELYLFY